MLQYKTDLLPILKLPARTVKPNFVYVVPDDSDPSGRTVFLELTPPPEIHYKTSPGSSQQMNVLGIVIFSATMGTVPVVMTTDLTMLLDRRVGHVAAAHVGVALCWLPGLLLGRMGERGAPLVNVCQCINECVMKIINAAVW